jgi:hypothetical protein
MKKCAFALLFFLGAFPASGQVGTEGVAFSLTNGIQVTYEIWNNVPAAAKTSPRDAIDLSQSLNTVSHSGSVIYRKLKYPDGTPWLGYEIHFDRSGDSTDFQISFAPLSGYPFFEQAPEARQVHDGDYVLLDVLEQPGTGNKVFDCFQVYLNGTPHAYFPMPEHNLANVIPTSANLRLDHARMAYSAYEDLAMLQDTSVLSGKNVELQSATVGRVDLSAEPGPGYRLEAVAEENRIQFVSGEDRYSITSNAPVVDQPGAWFVWVRFEPSAQFSAPIEEPSHDGPPPLELKLIPSTTVANAFLLQVQNVSNRTVIAYDAGITAADPATGKESWIGGSGRMVDVRPDGTVRPWLTPGQLVVERGTQGFGRVRNGKSIRPEVALVLFDDGTAWSPASAVDPQRTFSRQLLKAFQKSLAYQHLRQNASQ